MNKQKLLKLYTQHHVPRHVRVHMQKVAEVALKIAKKMKEQGIPIDLQTIRYGALFHDFFKVLSFRTFDPETWGYKFTKQDIVYWKKLRKNHKFDEDTTLTAKLLRKEKEPVLADLVEKQYFSVVVAKNTLKTWEEKIVYYADKRVLYDTVVTLKKRFTDGKKRYASDNADTTKTKHIEKIILHLEKDLCKLTKSTPEKLIK